MAYKDLQVSALEATLCCGFRAGSVCLPLESTPPFFLLARTLGPHMSSSELRLPMLGLEGIWEGGISPYPHSKCTESFCVSTRPKLESSERREPGAEEVSP